MPEEKEKAQKTFFRWMEEVFEDFERDLDKLDEQAGKLADEARDRAKETIASLKQDRDKLRVESKKFTESSGEAWEDLKSGFEDSWKELKEGFKNAFSEFKAGEPAQEAKTSKKTEVKAAVKKKPVKKKKQEK